jgi:hypothetical protein
MRTFATILVGATLALSLHAAQADDPRMSFFVTSVGLGDGGNLGGLDGADAHCQQLAEAAGSTGLTWRAYLSTQEEGKRGISARHRIGEGPWYNARGELIAVDLDQLHIMPNIYLRTALDAGRRVTRPARTGPRTVRVRRPWDTMTVMAGVIPRGMRPTTLAAAVRRICAAQVATDISTASQQTDSNWRCLRNRLITRRAMQVCTMTATLRERS